MEAATQPAAGPRPQQPYSPWFWVAIGALVLVQLAALVMLCSAQVRKAQDRDSHYVVQQLAVSDCLQYVPGSTMALCNQRLELVRASGQSAQEPTMSAAPVGATSVSFNYR